MSNTKKPRCKLKPCPFCGSAAMLMELYYPATADTIYKASCGNADCGASTSVKITAFAAATIWNRRASEAERKPADKTWEWSENV